MNAHTIGTKYNDKLTTKEIAAIIRADLKAEQKKGTLDPGYKFSVTRDVNSITATIKALPAHVKLTTPGYLMQSASGTFVEYYDRLPRHTPEVKAVLDMLKAKLNAFNFDNSDSMTDFFHVNFYVSVAVCWELERDVHKAMRATAGVK